MLEFDSDKVAANARAASTEDLLNRVTAYRDQMEAGALFVLEAELHRRGVTAAQILDHGERVKEGALKRADGTVLSCSLCREPAVVGRWGWFKLLGIIPLFPKRLRFCRQHIPTQASARA